RTRHLFLSSLRSRTGSLPPYAIHHRRQVVRIVQLPAEANQHPIRPTLVVLSSYHQVVRASNGKRDHAAPTRLGISALTHIEFAPLRVSAGVVVVAPPDRLGQAHSSSPSL